VSDFSQTRAEIHSKSSHPQTDPNAGKDLSGRVEISGAGELESLMARYQTADAQAGALLVEKLSNRIFQYFLAHVRNHASAEDLLQDFWLRIHNARHTFRSGEPLLPWIYAIAHRVRIDDYRRNRNLRLQDTLDEHSSYAASEEKPTPKQDIRELLQTLPTSQREAILLMKVGGLSLEEVARATGSTVGAVKQKVHRGYERLRSLLGGCA
jgi:RNA polymerase sigma-70 factor (ECF subfamily)